MSPQVLEQHRHAIEIRGLRAGYATTRAFVTTGRRLIIDEVSLKIMPGEIVGIIGRNGSGKTTLLRAVVDPDSRFGGEVLCQGRPLVAGQIAYVPQAPAATLSPWLTGMQEISLPLRVRGAPRGDCEKAVRDLIASLRVAVPLDRNLQSLSGGQRVKIALLRALAVPDPHLAVLDEPFEGLDTSSRATLVATIRTIASRGIPVLITSHRSEDLIHLGAKVLRVDGTPVKDLLEVEWPAGSCSGNAVNATTVGSLVPNGDAVVTAEIRGMSERGRAASAALFYGTVGLIVGALLWNLAARLVGNSGLLPGPLSVGENMVYLTTSPKVAPHFSATMDRALAGWLLANLAAIPLGVLLGYNVRVFQAVSPWLAVGRAAPIFVLVAPAAGLFPQRPEFQRCFLIWLTLFLISLQAVSVAAAMAPRRRVDIARVFGADYWFRLRHVLFREGISGTFSALEITFPIAIIATLVIEQFLIPKTGLGVYVFNHLNDPDLSLLVAHILLPGIIVALGLSIIRRAARAYRYEL
jgi:ABC-type multidrug transport system ATPase subunit/ABC-type nitrate/sulfonate/bicarbonate transport system permease component